MSVIWHDLECGTYVEDLELWRSLADEYGDPVLDIGAGTGRVTLHLARNGHRVTALDRDPELLEALRERAEGLDVETALSDARAFELGQRFALCVVPMQTIQLMGGSTGRKRLLGCARRHLQANGALAVAISERLDLFEAVPGPSAPLPDICEIGGVVYSSHPTAVRMDGDGFVLERQREIVAVDGRRSVTNDAIHLDALGAEQLEREGAATGLRLTETRTVPPTSEHVGSEVLVFGA